MSAVSWKMGCDTAPFIYANNEPKSALARDLGDCRDNKGKLAKRVFTCFIMDFSLLSPLEFFADPKNGDGRNNKPPAMRVRVDCYTKKLPFRLQ